MNNNKKINLMGKFKCAIFGIFTKLYLVNGDYLDMRSLASLKNESCWISWYLISVEPKRISTNWWGFNTDAILSVALNILVPLRTSAKRQPNDHLKMINDMNVWNGDINVQQFEFSTHELHTNCRKSVGN